MDIWWKDYIFVLVFPSVFVILCGVVFPRLIVSNGCSVGEREGTLMNSWLMTFLYHTCIVKCVCIVLCFSILLLWQPHAPWFAVHGISLVDASPPINVCCSFCSWIRLTTWMRWRMSMIWQMVFYFTKLCIPCEFVCVSLQMNTGGCNDNVSISMMDISLLICDMQHLM